MAMPEKIGKYLVTRKIGTGSTGDVFLCHDPYQDEDVAIKLYRFKDDGSSGSSVSRRIFFNEAQMVGKLRHPYILPLYDAGEVEGDCYVVMQLVRGARTLSAFCREENLLPVRKVLEIVFKVAKALDFAHRRGVIHRDIKPNNIMMTAEGDVRIVDFGIAISADQEGPGITGLTGSPSYMSPEQVQQKALENTSDIYSLGIVMYELLTGHRPFKADSLSRLMHQIVYATPAPMHKMRSDLPPVLDEIIAKALQKDPGKRYHSGLDLAADLIRAFEQLDRVAAEINEQERFNLIKELKFFRDFAYPEVWEVMHASEWVTHQASEEIISEGQIDDSFFIIVDGTVSVRKGGRELGRLNSGDCFGETGYLEQAKRPITILAETPVTVLTVNATLIEQLSMPVQLKFTKEFLRSLIERLNRSSEAEQAEA